MHKRVNPLFIDRLRDVKLNAAHQESLRIIIADKRKNERQKFFGTRDVIFDALIREHLGDAYQALQNSATEKAKTVMLLAQQAA